ncbi:MAG: methionyl-tRNA formyltransferase [Anaerolineae bacterium]|nr:methionyl-tRNA formyltransferase [Anaerolineae bacterium]
MGTPDFAVPTLRALLDHFDVAGVVTQPDRPAGRGRAVRESPVKRVAAQAGVPVFQPKTLRTAEAVTQLASWSPDVIVVAAFGQILRQSVLDLPPHGCINVHASLLPRWRGAAPIQAAIRAGDAVSGVTIMRMDAGLDTGPILAQRAIPLDPRETASTLHDRLAALGADLLIETLPGYLAGAVQPQPQPDDADQITLAPSIKKEEGAIDWSRPAVEIDRLVRAFDPWPGTSTIWAGQTLKILAGHPVAGSAPPGRVLAQDAEIAVGTGAGLFALERVQLEGRKALPVGEFARGRPDFVGSVLGQ